LPTGRDDTLHGLLAAIGDDAARQAGAVVDAILSEFAIKMDDARRREPRHQLAATLQALAQARASALVAAAEKAAAEVYGRQQAALAAHAGRPPMRQDKTRRGEAERGAPSPG
jgi:hypothetical protein